MYDSSSITPQVTMPIEILCNNKKLKAALEDEARCIRSFGKDMAKKIMQRLAGLQAAESLATFWPPKSLPERCHELGGNRKGIFTMDLKQPYRLLFRPIGELEPVPEDEFTRWSQIKTIDVIGIEDTHG